ncbi:MAG TPA: hypothetical protein PKA98_06455 [Acidimicrobiales bacterium]|nr:hypothetical protein [Acidimicrobiales bacterium]
MPPTPLVARPSVVVPLAGTGARRPSARERTPLVLVHDLSGEVAPLEAVARALPSDLPVLGLRSPLVGPRPERFTRVDALALRYLADLERADIRDPLLVVGVGRCALLAVAMAALARREGIAVGRCVAVDGGPGHLGPRAASPGRPRHLAGAGGLTGPGGRRRHARLLRSAGAPPGYDGVVDLLWAAGTASLGPTQGWGPHCAEVRVTRLRADHRHLLVGAGASEVAGVLAGLVAAAGPGSPGAATPA